MIGTVRIRDYVSADLEECRTLYSQLVEHHREIYADPTIGGDDPGARFDDYLALAARVATWVAIDNTEIVGLTGLLWEGDEATIEPVIVDRNNRARGVGRRLIETAVEDARRRGANYVNIKPVARNASAIQAFHQLGFRTLGHLQLFISLDPNESGWLAGLEIHGRRFDY
jgi:GNAT superfamily N-acetyltransferase